MLDANFRMSRFPMTKKSAVINSTESSVLQAAAPTPPTLHAPNPSALPPTYSDFDADAFKNGDLGDLEKILDRLNI